MTHLFLFVAAFLGGALNSVAGGGSFLALPALISIGVPAVSANATTTFAMWPGSLSSAIAYRAEIHRARAWLVALGAVSLLGGLIGGYLLVRTDDRRFLSLLPWLMFAAALTFTFGNTVVKRLQSRRSRRKHNALHTEDAEVLDQGSEVQGSEAHRLRTEHKGPRTTPLWLLLFQLVLAVYGGYFGGGMGIMMLAGLAVAGMSDIHEMNGIKAMLAVAINGVALVEFVVSGAIAWAPGLVMVAGGITGGYLGASIARQMPSSGVRLFVIALAWAMTVYFFYRG